MRKAWKIILIIALCILILGEIVLGVGLLSGGSPERVWDKLNEHYNFAGMVEFWNDNVANGFPGKLASDYLQFNIPELEIAQPTPEPTPTPTPTPKPTATPAPTEEPSAEPTATANP